MLHFSRRWWASLDEEHCKHSRANCSRLQFHGAPLAHSGASSFRSACVFARRRSIQEAAGSCSDDGRFPVAWAKAAQAARGLGRPGAAWPHWQLRWGRRLLARAPSRWLRVGSAGAARPGMPRPPLPPGPALSDPAPSAANVGHCTWLRPGSESTDPYGSLAASASGLSVASARVSGTVHRRGLLCL